MGYENSGRKSSIIKKQRLAVPPKPELIVPAGTRNGQQRFIRNEADERAFANGCRFNEALAMHVVDFFPKFLCHSQGKWAGQAFELDEWWVENVIFPIYGWVYPDGLRRIRDAYAEIGKKNGKSAVNSGLALYGLVGDFEAGAHNYSLGADSSQAGIVHGESISMVKKSPELDQVLEINNTTGEIRYPATDSFFRRSSSTNRGKSGWKAHFISCDELHEWYGRALWDDIEFAGDMRDQPLRLSITNSGKDLESVCYEQRSKALSWLSGETEDEQFFGLVMNPDEREVDAEIDAVQAGAEEIPVAASVNPMIGKILSERDMLVKIRNADTPPKRSNLKRYRYCIWVEGSDTPLLEPGRWKLCETSMESSELIGAPCAAGLDLGEISDPTSFSLVFPELEEDQKVRYRVLAWSWLARKNATKITNKNAGAYTRWEADPKARLKFTEGDVTDFAIVRSDIVELMDTYNPSVLIFDPRNAEKITQEITEGVRDGTGTVVIEGHQVERVAFPQTLVHYAEPTRAFEEAVLEKRLEHDGNPMLQWEANHCSYESDKDGNKKPVKPGSASDNRKVDAVQSVIMSIAGCIRYVDLSSAYNTPGGGAILL